MDYGISTDQFWNLSLVEIQDHLESHERKERRQTKQRLIEKHFLAKDIAQYVSLILNGSKEAEIMELWDYFPKLFHEEKPEVEEKRKNHDVAVHKAQMIDFAHRFNHARSGGGKAGRHDT